MIRKTLITLTTVLVLLAASANVTTAETFQADSEQSLRYAIDESNSIWFRFSRSSTINLQWPANEPYIAITQPLPVIRGELAINGGYVRLDGAISLNTVFALRVESGRVSVDRMVFTRFPGDVIVLAGGGNHSVTNCVIGTVEQPLPARPAYALGMGNGGTGILVDGSSFNTLRGNLIVAGGAHGVMLKGSIEKPCTNNSVSGLMGAVVTADTSEDLGVVPPHARDLAGDGVHLEGAIDNTISFSTIAGCKTGIQLENGSRNNVLKNNLLGWDGPQLQRSGNREHGIFVDRSAAVLIQSNHITMDLMYGPPALHCIEIRGPESAGAKVIGNHVGASRLAPSGGAAGHGIYINDCPRVVIGGITLAEGNTIGNNRQAGIALAGAATTDCVIKGNRIGNTGVEFYDPSPNDTGILIAAPAGNNIIGGSEPGEGNIISGNRVGIQVAGTVSLNNGDFAIAEGSSGNVIQGNLMGTMVYTDFIYPSPWRDEIGIALEATSGNVVSDNHVMGNRLYGIYMAVAHDNQILRNTLGVRPGDYTEIPNGWRFGATQNLVGPGGGILVAKNSGGNTIQSNQIVGNMGSGIDIENLSGRTPPQRNAWSGNAIYDNTGLGVDLGVDGVGGNSGGIGANLRFAPATLTRVQSCAGQTHIEGAYNTQIASGYMIEIFRSTTRDPSGYGEGAQYVGSYDFRPILEGNTFHLDLPVDVAPGEYVSAIIYHHFGHRSSEFSNAVEVQPIAPEIVALDPGGFDRVSDTVLIQIYGYAFRSDSVVLLDGEPIGSVFISENQIEIAVSGLMDAGTHAIRIHNELPCPADSNEVPLFVGNPNPSLTAIHPDRVPAGAYDALFVLLGSGFVPESIVLFDDEPILPISVDADQGRIWFVPAPHLLLTAHTARVSVINIGPGGGASNELTVEVIQTDSTPPSTGFSASPGENGEGWNRTDVEVILTANDEAGGSGVKYLVYDIGEGPVTVKGSTAKFTISKEGGTSVRYHAEDFAGNVEPLQAERVYIDKGAPVTIATVSGTQVTLSASDAVSGVDLTFYRIDGGDIQLFEAPFQVSASNPRTIEFWSVDRAGNKESPQTIVTGSNPVPSIIALRPSTGHVGDPVDLTVHGRFVPGSIVRWNGSARTTTFVSAYILKAQISGADTAVQGGVPVTVFNPAPGGGISNVVTFTIGRPDIQLTAVLSRSGPDLIAQITLRNTGNIDAPNVKLTGATLGSKPTGGRLPYIGTLKAGGSATGSIKFPGAAGVPGSTVPLIVQGGYDPGHSFTASVQVSVP